MGYTNYMFGRCENNGKKGVETHNFFGQPGLHIFDEKYPETFIFKPEEGFFSFSDRCYYPARLVNIESEYRFFNGNEQDGNKRFFCIEIFNICDVFKEMGLEIGDFAYFDTNFRTSNKPFWTRDEYNNYMESLKNPHLSSDGKKRPTEYDRGDRE